MLFEYFSEDFEALAHPLFERIRNLLNNLLQECGMQPNQVDEVEIVGGSSRIPAVKKVISEVFGKDPKTTMNQDEAVARGKTFSSIKYKMFNGIVKR